MNDQFANSCDYFCTLLISRVADTQEFFTLAELKNATFFGCGARSWVE